MRGKLYRFLVLAAYYVNYKTLSITCIKTSQNTMYCGGEPEHKRVVNKCMREEIHAHNNGK